MIVTKNAGRDERQLLRVVCQSAEIVLEVEVQPVQMIWRQNVFRSQPYSAGPRSVSSQKR